MTNVGNQIPRVFILGAGFSAAAGVPLTGELLQSTLLKFSAESPGIYRRLEGYALEALSQGDGPLDVSIKGPFQNCVPILNSSNFENSTDKNGGRTMAIARSFRFAIILRKHSSNARHHLKTFQSSTPLSPACSDRVTL